MEKINLYIIIVLIPLFIFLPFPNSFFSKTAINIFSVDNFLYATTCEYGQLIIRKIPSESNRPYIRLCHYL